MKGKFCDMKANNQVPDRDNASVMSPLRNLKERVETDMDISLIELPFALTVVRKVIATEIV